MMKTHKAWSTASFCDFTDGHVVTISDFNVVSRQEIMVNGDVLQVSHLLIRET